MGTGSRESTSRPQLALAEQRNPGPRYIEADMRNPPPGRFDAAINLFSSFGYFADRGDDIAAVRASAAALRPNGVLVMELMHRDLVAHLYGQSVDHGGPVSEEGVTDWVTGVRTATVTHGAITKTFRMRLYTVTELVGMLHDAGFQQIDALGDLAGGSGVTGVTACTSRREVTAPMWRCRLAFRWCPRTPEDARPRRREPPPSARLAGQTNRMWSGHVDAVG